MRRYNIHCIFWSQNSKTSEILRTNRKKDKNRLKIEKSAPFLENVINETI